MIFKKIFSYHGQSLDIELFSRFSEKSKSTSIHNLSADKSLNNPLRILYIFLNWLNNLSPYFNVNKNLEIRDFKCFDLRELWKKCYIKSSPSRKLSDLFWMCLPWKKIKDELKEINILDIGCGSGNYGRRLVDFSGNKINQYIGSDVNRNENWEKLKQKFSYFKFYVMNSKNIYKIIPNNTNFFMTQSAIEHFIEDISFFKIIKDYIISSKKNVIQIHLFPSLSCLPLYGYHGVRQYTPRTISKIIRLFNDFSYSILFNLGGKFCNYLHYKYITKPLGKKLVDMRDIKTDKYDKLLFNSIKKDMKYPQKKPSFYALLIHSNWKKKIY